MNKVPNLRFKGFNEAWQHKKLCELADVLSGKRIPKGMNLVEYDTGIPYITVSDMGEQYVDMTNLKYITPEIEEHIRKYKVLQDDIIISVAGTLGKVNLIQRELENANLTENCDKITNLKETNYRYLYYYLNTVNIQNQISSVNTISSQPKLALTCIRDFDINIPSLEEQEKIASFFSLIDKKIELQNEKFEELKNYKKGIMQKIFSQQLRFKDEDGNDFPEWEEKKLENIFEFFKGNGLSKSDLVDNGNIPCVLYGELFTQYDEVISIVKSRCLKDQGFKSQKYDILMPTSDVTPEGLATASCILVDDVCLGGDINVLRPKKYINGIFLSYQINYFKSLIIRKVSGTTIKHIYVKDIKDIKYNIPCEKEQVKITDLLLQIDSKIKFESLKLECYHELKKGLLQQMFI